MTLPLWIEVHVDDFVLSRSPERWPESAALLDDIARRAESAGARLSFRIMETFAGHDRGGFLTGLVQRGHEVGWHAHGRRLGKAVAALQNAGVVDAARIGAPGLVQAGERGRRRLLREAHALGLRILTDRLETRHHAYQGWLAWEALPGLISLDVSVDPFDWGVLVRHKGEVRHGYGTMDFAHLADRVDQRSREPAPPGAAAFFGATFHEHNLTVEGSLRPAAATLDAFSRFCDRFGERIVPSAEVVRTGRTAEDPSLARPTPPGALFRKATLSLARRLNPRPFTPRPDALVLQPGEARPRANLPNWQEDFWLTIDQRRIAVRRIGLATGRMVVVVVHGGVSGIDQGLSFAGLPDDALAAHDIVLYVFARSEGHRTPGNPVHIADTRAVLRHALAEGPPVGLLTWSAGVIPALHGVSNTEEGRRVRFLMDCEGPVDRHSVVPPNNPTHELATLDVWSDGPWAGREAIRLIGGFPGAYHRVQAGLDHVHGRMADHARRIVAAHPRGRLNGRGEILPGKLWEHGAQIFDWIGALSTGTHPPHP